MSLPTPEPLRTIDVLWNLLNVRDSTVLAEHHRQSAGAAYDLLARLRNLALSFREAGDWTATEKAHWDLQLATFLEDVLK